MFRVRSRSATVAAGDDDDTLLGNSSAAASEGSLIVAGVFSVCVGVKEQRQTAWGGNSD